MPFTRPAIAYKTERLTLSPTSLEDADMILRLLNTEGWIEQIGDRNVHTKEEAEAYIENRMISQYNQVGFGNFTLSTNATNEKIGTAGIYQRPGQEDVDIGFALLPEYMRHGYSYEASYKLMQLAKSEFNIAKMTAVTLPTNKASIALIEKLGLHYTDKVVWDGAELNKYSIDMNNWQG